MSSFSQPKKQYNRAALEAYRTRLQKRLDRELRRYGFSWSALVSAWRLPEAQKRFLDEQWQGYYHHSAPRPSQPNPLEYEGYLEFLRIESLLADPHVQMVEQVFGI